MRLLSQCLPRPHLNLSSSRGSRPMVLLHLLRRRTLVTLAIETSCDDTAVAVLSRTARSTELLFNERISSDNRAFRGIHPLVAVRGHSEALAPLVRKALAALPDAPTEIEAREERAGGVGTAGKRARARYCFTEDGVRKQVPDFVAVTRGPGMRSNLGIGLDMAKGLAVAWGVPLLGVHHMQAHALTPRLVRALGMSMGETKTEADGRNERGDGSGQRHSGPEFPFLSLLVSGGHTQLVHSAGLTDHSLVATSGDIAIGNLLDQTARDILPADIFETSDTVMYGRLLEAFAFPASPPSTSDTLETAYEAAFTAPASRAAEMAPVETGYSWTIPLPFRQSRKLAFSFSSIYTNVHNIATANPDMSVEERRALAQHTMAAAFTHLAGRLCVALEDRPDLQEARTLVVAGGVASNKFLMHVLRRTLAARGFGGMEIVAPPVELCTDNAAMIAWTAMEMFEAGYESELSITSIGRWPMDPEHGEGILGVEGWINKEPKGISGE